METIKKKRNYREKILKYLDQNRESTLSDIYKDLEIPSKSTVSYHLKKLRHENIIELSKTEGIRKYYSLVSFSRRYLDKMEDYPTVTISPFCPVVAGSHVVLRGGNALVLPLNAYVCIGVRKRKVEDKALEPARVKFDEITARRTLGIGREEVDKVANAAVKEVFNVMEIDNLEYNFDFRMYSDLDISRGCGGSGAVAASTVLALYASLGKIKQVGPLINGSKEYHLATKSAYRIEQIIHGKGALPKECSPFSSGASPICGFNASGKARALSYRLTNWDQILEDPDQFPKEEIGVVTKKSLNSLMLLIGPQKSTKECLRRVHVLQDWIGKPLHEAFYEFWKYLSNDIIASFRSIENQKGRKETDRAVNKTGELLKIQNGLYYSLGLDDPTFTDLIRKLPFDKCAGGSIIGGGMGGTCLLLSNNLEILKEEIKPLIVGYADILPDEALKAPKPAQVLRLARA